MAMEILCPIEGFIAGFLQCGDGGVNFRGGDLFGRSVDETELAGGEIVLFRAHGWAEGTAEDGAVFIEVAGAVVGVENWARFVVSELLKENGGLVVRIEDSGGSVAGKPWVEASYRVGNSFLDAGGFLRVGLFECGETFAQTGTVFMGDGKDTDTALGTTGVADKVRAAASVGVGDGCVYDLNQGFVTALLAVGVTHRDLSSG